MNASDKSTASAPHTEVGAATRENCVKVSPGSHPGFPFGLSLTLYRRSLVERLQRLYLRALVRRMRLLAGKRVRHA